MAAVTTRVRLITGIVIAPLRPAGVLAKQAATLDALSGGRFVMGVSTSWQAEEYQALNAPFAERGAVLTETLGACRALWGSASASYHGQYVNFDEMVCEPRPEHVDDIKVWLGGALTPRLVKRIAQYGHGWMPFVGLEKKPLEKMAEGRKRLEAALQAAGRDPRVLEISPLLMPRGRDLSTALNEDVPKFQAAGATGVRVQISTFISEIERVPAFLEDLARAFEPFRA